MSSANSMESFVAVVDQGSFAAAARLMGVPTSTVSRQVSRLEDRLETRLLHRTTRKLSPTDAGWTYYERARNIVLSIREADEAVLNLHTVPRGLLRIAAPPTSARAKTLESLLPGFLMKYPEVTCEVVASSRYADLVEEGFDLAIRAGSLEDSSYIARRLVTSHSGAVASTTYLDGYGRPANPDELADHCCIRYRGQDGPTRWPLANGQWLSVSGPLVTNDMGLVAEAVLQGLGIAVLPLGFLREELAEGRVEQVLEGVVGKTSNLQLVYPSGKHLSAKVRAFIDFALQYPNLADLF